MPSVFFFFFFTFFTLFREKEKKIVWEWIRWKISTITLIGENKENKVKEEMKKRNKDTVGCESKILIDKNRIQNCFTKYV